MAITVRIVILSTILFSASSFAKGYDSTFNASPPDVSLGEGLAAVRSGGVIRSSNLASLKRNFDRLKTVARSKTVTLLGKTGVVTTQNSLEWPYMYTITTYSGALYTGKSIFGVASSYASGKRVSCSYEPVKSTIGLTTMPYCGDEFIIDWDGVLKTGDDISGRPNYYQSTTKVTALGWAQK